MKIAVISSTVFRVPLVNYGGLEHIAWQVASGLARKGHQVALVAPDGSECPGCQVIPTGPAGQHYESEAYGGYPEARHGPWQIARRSHQGYWQHLLHVDAVIDHSWQKHAYSLKQEGKLRAPVLGVCHAPVNTMFASLPPGVDRPCFVCISQDQAAHFQALFNRPARVAYNGIDLDFYKPMDGVKRTDRFLFLARFSRIKGAHLAIDACLKAGVGLDLIGDTSLTGEPEYLETCRRMADGEQIRIIGGISRGEAVYWMSRSRGFIHLARDFREPFGLAPVEAQAGGNGVLCWDNGAMRETVRHGDTGFVVDSLEAAVDVLKSGAMDSLDRARCREWARQFSVEVMVSRYEQLCGEAISTGGW